MVKTVSPIYNSATRLHLEVNSPALRRPALELLRGPHDISVESIATMIAAPLVYRTVWEHQDPTEELVETAVRCKLAALRPAGRAWL